MAGERQRLPSGVGCVFATVIGMGWERRAACAGPRLKLVRNVTSFLYVAAAAAAVTLTLPADAAATPPARVQVLVTPATSVTAARWSVSALGGDVQLVRDGAVQALVRPAQLGELRRSSAVAAVAPAPVASADVVTSEGVSRIGAELLQRQGLDGAGVRIAILDQAFGPVADLDALAGSELPALARQHRRSFDATYGLAGRDYYGNASRHGEMLAEIAYDLAPGADYWLVNYRTSAEFDEAVDHLLDEVHPDVVIHANSFLFGPFDGSGWFARRVDAAAAKGVLWVNSVGNYGDRHYEGTFQDLDGDGSYDVPGFGDVVPVSFAPGEHAGCDLSWPAADPSGQNGYALGLFEDPNATVPALDPRTGQAIVSTFVSDPEPHVTLGPADLPHPGALYLRIWRVGAPADGRLTLFCRFALPVGMRQASSSVPTPGDARGALSVGAFDAASFAPEAYSSQGPTDDGRLKPDLSAPTNVSITGRTCGGTSCATPHVAAAAALVWQQVAAAGGPGSVASRVAARLESSAFDAGDPGPDELYGAGRLRFDVTPPTLGQTSPPNGALTAGTVALTLPLADDGVLDRAVLTVDGLPLPLALGTDGFVRANLDTGALPDGRHALQLTASDRVGNASAFALSLVSDNTPPALRLAGPMRALAGAPVRVRVTSSDRGSGVTAAPDVAFGDGRRARAAQATHRYVAAGWRTVTATVFDHAGNRSSAHLRLRIAELATVLRGRTLWVSVGRRDAVVVRVKRGRKVVQTVRKTLKPGAHRIQLERRLKPGRYAVSVSARGSTLARTLVVRRTVHR
jgi:hypothetical protein